MKLNTLLGPMHELPNYELGVLRTSPPRVVFWVQNSRAEMGVNKHKRKAKVQVLNLLRTQTYQVPNLLKLVAPRGVTKPRESGSEWA